MSAELPATALAPEEAEFVAEAARALERPGFAIRAANLAGRPVEAALQHLPGPAREAVERSVDGALRRALAVAVRSLGRGSPRDGSLVDLDRAGRHARLGHALATVASGAAGGLFGLPGLAVELPLTTSLMLRSIASTARSFGEDLRDPEARLECLAVFAHGGPAKGDDAVESTYYAARVALASTVREAARFVATASAREIERHVARGTAPVLVRLVARIASRFDVVVTEKILAGSVPIAGALGAAIVNAAFVAHFNEVARFHFGIRRLERLRGETAVRAVYDRASAALARPARAAAAL